MPQTISCNVSAQIAGGPTVTVPQSFLVDAYDKIDVVIPPLTPGAGGGAATPGTATVQVQPSPGGSVKFLLVMTDNYNAQLSYTVDGRATSYRLDAPHLLLGDGAVGMLGNTQRAFAFSNTITPATPVAITILV